MPKRSLVVGLDDKFVRGSNLDFIQRLELGYHLSMVSLKPRSQLKGVPLRSKYSSCRNVHFHPARVWASLKVLLDKSRFLRLGNACERVMTGDISLSQLLARVTLSIAARLSSKLSKFIPHTLIRAEKKFDSAVVLLDRPMATKSGSVPRLERSRSFIC
jgi:hypothetical protein